MKKRGCIVLGFLAAAFLAAGCGSRETAGQKEEAYRTDAADEEAADRACVREETAAEGEAAEGYPEETGDGAAGSTAGETEGAFYIYSWDEEIRERLKYVYEALPEAKERVQYVCVGTRETFPEEIALLLQDPEGEAYPDMIALSPDWMMEYTNSGILLPVTDCGIADTDLGEMNPYTITIAMDKKDYTLKGMAWKSSPGAFFYRADMAESLLGVNNPDEMQERIGSWEGFLETAREVKRKSDGTVKILASDDGIMEIAMFLKARPWVAMDGVFRMDEAALIYMDVVRALEKEELTLGAGQGTEGWKKGFSDGSVFGYFGGADFPGNSIRPNCGGERKGQGTYGLWNVCQGPVPYALGGTWLGVTAGCQDTVLAGQIMKALCCNGEIMAGIAEGTGDYVNNKAVMDSLYGGKKGICGLLGGQNPMEVYARAADGAEAFWMCPYDREINGWLEKQAEAYAAGEKGKEEAVEDFKRMAAEALPAVIVE